MLVKGGFLEDFNIGVNLIGGFLQFTKTAFEAIWGYIWKHTVEKSQTNVTDVTMPLLMQAIWGDTW